MSRSYTSRSVQSNAQVIFVRSFVRPFVRSFVRSCVRSFVRSFLPSFLPFNNCHLYVEDIRTRSNFYESPYGCLTCWKIHGQHFIWRVEALKLVEHSEDATNVKAVIVFSFCNIAWAQIVRKKWRTFLAKTSRNIQRPYTPHKNWRRWNELFGTPAVFHLYENRKEMTWHLRVTDNAERKGHYRNACT